MNKKYLSRHIQKYTQAAIYVCIKCTRAAIYTKNLKWGAIYSDPNFKCLISRPNGKIIIYKKLELTILCYFIN